MLELCENGLTFVNTNPHIEIAIKNITLGSIPDAVLRADRYGVSLGRNLTNYVREHYTSISSALLTPQHEILERMRNLDTYIDIDNVETLMKTVSVDHWVFISYSVISDSWNSRLIDTVVNIDTDGEKIFYSDRRNRIDQFLIELEDIKSSNMVIFVDNHVLMKRIMSSNLIHSALKVFYLHGDKSK